MEVVICSRCFKETKMTNASFKCLSEEELQEYYCKFCKSTDNVNAIYQEFYGSGDVLEEE